MSRRIALRMAVVAGFVLTGCASGSSSSSSDGASAPTITPAADDATTVPGSTDTGSVPADTADQSSETPLDPEALAIATVQAALDTLPVDWAGTIASDLGEEGDEGDDIVFAACLAPDDYNLDNLDPDSAASWELDALGPASGSPFGGPQASLEARVFADAAVADAGYAVLERVLGTDEGRECLANEVPGQLVADAPEGTVFDSRVEGTTIEGADVGARIVVTFTTAGITGEIFVDLVALYDDATRTIFATFTGFGVPVDQAVASAMFTAAVAVS